MSEAAPPPNAPAEESEAAAREREAQAIRGLAMAYSRMREEIGKVIVGQRDVVDPFRAARSGRAQFCDDTVVVGHQDRLAASGQAHVFAQLVLEDFDADCAHGKNVATSSYNTQWQGRR